MDESVPLELFFRNILICKLVKSNVQASAFNKRILLTTKLEEVDRLKIQKHQMLMILTPVKDDVWICEIRRCLVDVVDPVVFSKQECLFQVRITFFVFTENR